MRTVFYSLFFVSILLIPGVAYAQSGPEGITSLQQLLDFLQKMLDAFLLLPGAAVIVPAVIAVLKKYKVIEDGQSGLVQFGINGVLYALFIVGANLAVDVVAIDGVLEKVAALIVAVVPLIGLPLVSKAGYAAGKKFNVPLLGYSFAK